MISFSQQNMLNKNRKKILRIQNNLKYRTLPKIHKRAGIYIEKQVEATPIVYKDRLLTITFSRALTPFDSKNYQSTGIWIHDFFTKELIADIPWEFGLGCAIVIEDKIIVFGTKDWGRKNAIYTAQINSDFTLENTQLVLEALPDQKFFNMSVCLGESSYIMAYEVSEPNQVDFSIRFAQSHDLKTWKKVGTIFHPDIYAACPTIKYLKGYYYIVYLRHEQHAFVEFIARTKDFFNFEDFNGNSKWDKYTQVLSPKNVFDEAWNNSDIDFVEYNGFVYFTYGDGDQQGNDDMRTAVYFGTLEQFFQEFWN